MKIRAQSLFAGLLIFVYTLMPFYLLGMQQPTTPLLNNGEVIRQVDFLSALQHGALHKVVSYLEQGFDPDFVLDEIQLTPLGLICQRLCSKYALLKEHHDNLGICCCGCFFTRKIANLENEIKQLEHIIELLSPKTDIPTTNAEWVHRTYAYTVLQENNRSTIATQLSLSLSSLTQRSQKSQAYQEE